MNKILTILAALLIAVTGCASPPAVNDVKVTQAVKVSPPTWADRTFTPVANSLFGFDSSVLPVNVTLGGGLSLDATTHVLTALVNSVNANSLTGTTLASNVVNSSLTSVGTLTDLTVTNTIVGNISGNAGSSSSAGLASNIFITNDTTTAAIMHLVWVTGSPDAGSKVPYIANSKFLVNPSTGQLYATNFMGTHTGNVIGGSGTFTALTSTVPIKNGGFSRLSSDVVVSASTTLADLTGLTANLLAGLTYSFHAVLLVTQSSTGGYKIDIVAYGGLTVTDVRFTVKGFLGSSGSSANIATVSQLSSLGGGGASITSTASGNGEIEINGTITVNAAGLIYLQGAQQSAAGTSTFKQGSFLEVVQQPL